jgi:RNA polymerase sigma-70 factor (ECF subfamily)
MSNSEAVDHIEQWVQAAQSGDWAALEALYEYFFEPLHRFCHWQCQDTQLAEDLTAETLLTMVRSIKSYKQTGSFKNWLYTIAKRTIAKWLRTKYQETAFADEYLELPDNPELIDPDNEKLKQNYVEEILATLSPTHRRILELRYVQNHTVAEVCKKLHLSESQVKVYTLRAKQKIRERYTGTYEYKK